MSYDARFGLNFAITPMVRRLLVANTVVFAVTLMVGQRFAFDWFAFQPTNVVFRPWGPLTYMFLHGDLGHLAVNMLVLFFFGPRLEAKWGESEFLRFFLICGLGGAVLSFVFLPSTVIGASAATYGVMLAYAMNWPDQPIYVFGIFPVPAKYLVGFLALVAMLSAAGSVQGGSSIAHFAHLGGLIAGYVYLKADFRTRSFVEGVRRKARPRRLAIVPREEPRSNRPTAGISSPREEARLYDEVDAVLDKISAEGMSALTEAELRLLDEVSKRHRTN